MPRNRASDQRQWEYSNEELDNALHEVVNTSGHVGLVRTLLNMGADANKVRDGNRRSINILRDSSWIPRSVNYINVAATNNQIELVAPLARRGASTESKSKALETAIHRNLGSMVETFLKYEADPNALGGRMLEHAVSLPSLTVVDLLLRAPHGINRESIDAALPIAVAMGQVEIVAVMVAYGADINFQQAVALREAVKVGRVDLVHVLVGGNPTSEHCSLAFEHAFSLNRTGTADDRYLLVLLLLNAGASGHNVAETLIKVVQAGHPFHPIAELLIDRGASLQHKEGRALETAVARGDLSMLKILLRGSVTDSDLARAFERTAKTFGRKTYDLMSTLISRGAKGVPLDRALVRAVQLHENKIIELLLDHNARTDFNDAQALQIAVSTGALDVVDVMLRKGRPCSDSMKRVFHLIPKRPPRLRHDLTRMLPGTEVSSGISPVQLGAALCDALQARSQDFDTDLVKFLIGAGADVNSNGGQCVRTIVESGDVELLKRVIGAKAQRSSISSAIPQAMTISLSSARLEIMKSLLNNGASGPNVAQALVAATAMGHQELGLIHSLLKASGSNQVGKRALTNAVMFCSKEIVESIITKGNLNQESCQEAFQCIFKRKVRQGLEKAEVILRLGVDQNSVNIALVEELTNRERIDPTLVKLLLQHGARCDYADGGALALAIDSGDSALLQMILIRNLDPRILAQKVLSAIQIPLPQQRYDTISLLLRAGAAGPEMNDALVHEICGSAVRDQSLIRLLMDHGAEVGPKEGALVRKVINDPLRLELLRLLSMAKDWTRAARHAISPAMELTDFDRYEVLEILVGSRSGGFEMDAALASAVMETPPNSSIISLLLRQGASINFQEGQALKSAVERADVTTVKVLLEKAPELDIITAAFELAMEIPGDRNVNGASTRLSLIKLFTNGGIRGSQQVHVAVIRAVQQPFR